MPAADVPTLDPSLRRPAPQLASRERTRWGTRHQGRKRRGTRVAQSGQVGSQRSLAKLEKTAGAGAERIQVVIVVSNRLISCISSGESAQD